MEPFWCNEVSMHVLHLALVYYHFLPLCCFVFLKRFVNCYFMCMNVLLGMYVSVLHVCVPVETRRGHWLSWDGSYGLLKATVWFWEPNLSSFLTNEPSLQAMLYFLNVF